MFAAGGWDIANTDELLARGKSLRLLGIDDSRSFKRFEIWSRLKKDRHARIGHGMIGTEALKRLVLAPELAGKAFVLESEKGADGTHREDIAKVLSWS